MSSSKTSPDDFFLSRKRLFRTRILNPFFPFLSQSIVSVCGNFFHSSSLYPSRSIVFCMNSSNSVFYFDVWQMCLLVYFICHSVVMLTISSEQTKGTQKKNIDLYAKTFGLHYWNEIWSIRKSHHNESNVFLSFNVLLAVFSREYIAMYQRHTHSKHNTRHRAHSFNKLNAKCQTLNHKRCFKREHKGLSHRTLDLVTLVQMNDKNDDERRTEKKEWVSAVYSREEELAQPIRFVTIIQSSGLAIAKRDNAVVIR